MNKILEEFKNKLILKKLSSNTIASYYRDVMAFLSYLETEYEERYEEVKKTHILTYLVELQKNGKSSATISRNISSIKNFYDFLIEDRMIAYNPAYNIHSPKNIRKKPTVLSEDEISTLMNIPKIDTFIGSRDSAILELLYSSGIKVTELINIKVEHLIASSSLIHIFGDNSRVVPIGQTALNSIMWYKQEFRDVKYGENCEYLFLGRNGESISRQGVWKILKQYEKMMDIGKVISPQILRNSFAVHMISRGASLAVVSDLLGNKNINTVQNFLQSVDNNTLQTYKNAHPRA